MNPQAEDGTVTIDPQPTIADLLAEAVLGCPGVVDLHGGSFGTVATYLPGRQIVGIRLPQDRAHDGEVEIHLTGLYPHPVHEIAAQVHAAVHAVLPGARVAVTVEDIQESSSEPGVPS